MSSGGNVGSAASAAVHLSCGCARAEPGTESDSTAQTAESQTASESKPGAGSGRVATAPARAATASEGNRMEGDPDECASIATAAAAARGSPRRVHPRGRRRPDRSAPRGTATGRRRRERAPRWPPPRVRAAATERTLDVLPADACVAPCRRLKYAANSPAAVRPASSRHTVGRTPRWPDPGLRRTPRRPARTTRLRGRRRRRTRADHPRARGHRHPVRAVQLGQFKRSESDGGRGELGGRGERRERDDGSRAVAALVRDEAAVHEGRAEPPREPVRVGESAKF